MSSACRRGVVGGAGTPPGPVAAGGAPDLIGRNFGAEQVNRKWYGDGTEVPTDDGKLHLD